MNTMHMKIEISDKEIHIILLEENSKVIELIPGNELPFQKGTLDRLVIDSPFPEMEQSRILMLLREIRRILKPGGELRLSYGTDDRLAELAPFAGLYPDPDQSSNQVFRTRKAAEKQDVPLVSIVIPAYKSHYFEDALLSALNQSYPKLEIVVCDDSPDHRIEQIVKQYAGDKRLRYHRNEKHLGGRGNYLQCFQLAKGEYIKFLNDDDLLHPRCVETMAFYLRTMPEVSLVTSYRQLIDHFGRPQGDKLFNRRIVRENSVIRGENLANLLLSRRVNFIGEPTTVMFRKADLSGTKPHIMSYNNRPALANGDVTIWVNLLGRGDAVYLVQPLSYFRIHRHQVQKQQDFKKRGDRAWEVIREDARAMGLLQNEASPELSPEHVHPAPDFPEYPIEKQNSDSESETAFIKFPKQPADSAPEVSIIIPVFNNLSYTRKCLWAISKNTGREVSYEIVVVDNGSTDGTEEFLREIQQNNSNFQYLRNSRNLGFARACNQGADAARGKYLIFLNNDTEPQPDWLNRLIEPFRTNESIGVVGARLIYPDGTIQHAGIEMMQAAEPVYLRNYGATMVLPEHPYRFAAPTDPRVMRPRELDMVTGACLAIPAQLFQKVNGFDEAYLNGGEDADLCFKVRADGYKVLYQPEALVIHHEGKTESRFQNVREVTERLFQRWGWTLNDDWKFDPALLPLQQWSDPVRKNNKGIDSVPAVGDAQRRFAELRHEIKLLRQQNNSQKIVELYQEFIRAHPTYAVAHNELGVFYFKQKDLARAVHHLQIAHGLEPENTAIMKNLADVYRFLNLSELATFIYQTLLDINPEDLSVLLAQSDIFIHQKNWKKALAYLTKANILAPENEKILQKIATVREKINQNKTGTTHSKKDRSNFGDSGKEKCPVCGSTKYESFRYDESLFKCHDCGTIYRSSDIVSHGTETDFRTPNMQNNAPVNWDEFRHEIEKLTRSKGKFLDIGSDGADFTHSIQQSGYQPVGKMGFRLKDMFFSHSETSQQATSNPVFSEELHEQIALITLRQTPGQVQQPMHFLKTIFHLLQPGGLVAGIVPNIDSFLSDHLKDKWPYLADPQNIVFFTPQTLRARLNEAGFQVEQIITKSSARHKGILHEEIIKIFGEEAESYAEAMIQSFEENGYGEEIWFFARKPDREIATGKEPTNADEKENPTHSTQHTFSSSRKPRSSGKRPDVSIIIPLYNQVEYTRKCLQAIYRNTCPDVSFEVILVDNASQDETPQFLKQAAEQYQNLRYLRNQTNRYFAHACNQGAEIARGRYLVFLNNDTEPQSGWLKAALQRFRSEKNIGIVGSKLLYPDGTIQHCGIEFMQDVHPDYKIWPLHRHLHQPADLPEANRPEEVHAVTGACLFIPRKLFKRVNGFSEEYRMYFEDTDLCFKVRREGYRIFYEPQSVVIHYEGKSSSDRKTIDELNTRAAKIFYRKWEKEIQHMEFDLLIEKQEGKFYYLRDDLFPAKYEEGDVTLTGMKLAELFGKLEPFYAHIGGAGDALLLLSRFYGKEPVTTIVSVANSTAAMKSFFSAFPQIKKVYFISRPDNDISQALLRKIFANLPNCLGMGVTPESEFYEEEWNESLDIFTRYKVTRRPEWIRMFRKQKLTSPQVVIHPRGSLKGMVGSKRNIIHQKYWIPLLKLLQQHGFQPVIIGTPDERKMYPALLNALDKRSYSFQEQMEIIASSDLFIGADSWGKTFSALAGIPTIVFHSVVGQDLEGWKDASDYVFLDPWEEIWVVESFQEFLEAFQEAQNILRSPQRRASWKKQRAPKKRSSGSILPNAIYLWREGGMGDVLMSFPLTRALKEKYPNRHIVYITSEANVPLVQANPYVDKAIPSRHISHLLNEKVAIHNLNPAKFGTAPRHQVDMFLDEFHLTVPAEKKEIVIHVPTEADQKVQALLHREIPHEQLNRPRILIHPAKGDANRTWPKEYWENLTRWLLEQGLTVLLTGSTSHDPNRGVHHLKMPGLIDLVNQLTPLEFVALCQQSQLLITTDSGPVQLAAASDIAIAAMYTVIPGKFRLPYRHGIPGWNAVAIESSCPYSGCYLYMNQEKYANQILEQVKSGQMSQKELFATWCLNEEKFACMHQLLTPEVVKQKIQPILQNILSAMADTEPVHQQGQSHSSATFIRPETVAEKITAALTDQARRQEEPTPAQTLTLLEEKIRQQPRNRRLWLEYMHRLKQTGDNRRLIATFAEYLKIYPGDSEVLNEMGVLLWNSGQRKEAVGFLERALLNNRENPEYLKNLGEAYLALENFDDAIKVFVEMMRRFPNDFYAYQVMAELYVENNDWESAQELIREFLRKNPDHAQANQMLEIIRNKSLYQAFQLINAGDFSQARMLLEEIVRKNPHHVQANLALGSLALNQGNMEIAEQYFRKVLAQDATNPEALLSLSRILLNTRRLEEFDQLVSGHSLSFQQQSGLRKMLIEREVILGRVPQALEKAQAFLTEYPGETDVQLLVGDLYMHLNQPERARQIYRQVLKSEPQNSEARERLEKLESMLV